jgi:hypothetical protein
MLNVKTHKLMHTPNVQDGGCQAKQDQMSSLPQERKLGFQISSPAHGSLAYDDSYPQQVEQMPIILAEARYRKATGRSFFRCSQVAQNLKEWSGQVVTGLKSCTNANFPA